MKWVEPKFTTKQIDEAGRDLANGPYDPQKFNTSLQILNNWRAAHAYPLNTMQLYLRKASYKIDENSLVAQRLKKLSSILFKLQRMPKMELSRMQDIGGCRAIMSSISTVNKVYNYYLSSRMKHVLANEKNYITNPKESGYRGIHLIYKYNCTKLPQFNNLLVEIQLRTKLQHIWATTVETVGLFINQSLKSSMGSDNWLLFFSLISSVFAIEEESVTVPNTSSDISVLKEMIKELVVSLKIIEKLRSYKSVIKFINEQKWNATYYLLYLEPSKKKIYVTPYRMDEIEKATEQYLEYEKKIGTTGNDVVLVSSDSIENLKTAYPNFFWDTSEFTKKLQAIIK